MDSRILLVAMLVAMVHCEKCTDVELSGNSGSFQSPGYGAESYGNNIDCAWTITAPEGRRIQLRFQKFNVISKFRTCQHDYVEVIFGSSDKKTYCTSFRDGNKPPAVINSITNVLKLRLISDDFHSNGKGFDAKYTVVDERGIPIEPEDPEDEGDDDWEDDSTTTTTTTTPTTKSSTTTPPPKNTATTMTRIPDTTTLISKVTATPTTKTSTTTTLISKIMSSTTAINGEENPSNVVKHTDVEGQNAAQTDDGISSNAGAMSGAVLGGIIGIVLVIFGILLIVAFVHWKRNKNKRINLSVIETSDGKSLITDNKIYKKPNYKIVRDSETTETFPL